MALGEQVPLNVDNDDGIYHYEEVHRPYRRWWCFLISFCVAGLGVSVTVCSWVAGLQAAPGVEVSWTAKVMAGHRALETRRPDALFRDPFAETLAGAEAITQAALTKKDNAVRTRFFDDFLQRHAPRARQIVVLGAGLDTRPWRMAWPEGTHIYELDDRTLLGHKATVLQAVAPQCEWHPIAADLRDAAWADRLVESGFVASAPSIWLLEGLLYYLDPAEVDRVMTAIGGLAGPGSWIGGDVIGTASANRTGRWADNWKFGCDDAKDFFRGYGWKATVRSPGEVGAAYGRLKAPPKGTSNAVRPGGFVTASRAAG